MSPCEFYMGEVIATEPLAINIDQTFTLTEDYLRLTNAVKDHSVDITVGWTTEDETEHVHENGNEGKPTFKTEHKHNIIGRKRITIHNGLTTGEKVLLLREQGGQSYIVIDRVGEAKTEGEKI